MHTFTIGTVQESDFNQALIADGWVSARILGSITHDMILVLRDRDHGVYAWVCGDKIITLASTVLLLTFGISQAFGQALRDGKNSFEFEVE